MKQRLIETVGRSARLKVLLELKRSVAGLAVGDLAERLKMSYMGVKDLCTDLEKRGLLDTWRQPQKLGRPHLLYRLTIRAHELFPTASNAFTLDVLRASQKLYGVAAAEKLLMVAFQAKGEAYQARVKGDTLGERAESLAKIREGEGCMSDFEAVGGGFKITEHHSPILDVLEAYPSVGKLEAELFQRVLGAAVRREESRASGLYCAIFWIGP